MISLTIFKNGYLAYSEVNTTIKILNLKDGSLVKTLNEEGNSTIKSMNILQNGNLVSGLDNGEILLWNPISGTIIKKVKASQSVPNGKRKHRTVFLARVSRF